MFRMQRTPLRQAKYNRNKQKCAVQRAARASTRSAVGSRSQFPMKLGSPGSVGLLPHRWISGNACISPSGLQPPKDPDRSRRCPRG
jgi:hypothetical protein